MVRSFLRAAACMALFVALGACGGGAQQTDTGADRTVLLSGTAAQQSDGGADCTLMPTPDGPWPSACVHEVPSGATIAADGGTTVVTLDGEVVATFPPCPCPTKSAQQ